MADNKKKQVKRWSASIPGTLLRIGLILGVAAALVFGAESSTNSTTDNNESCRMVFLKRGRHLRGIILSRIRVLFLPGIQQPFKGKLNCLERIRILILAV